MYLSPARHWLTGSAVLLAENFDVRTGSVNVTVPDVITGDDFSIVRKC